MRQDKITERLSVSIRSEGALGGWLRPVIRPEFAVIFFIFLIYCTIPLIQNRDFLPGLLNDDAYYYLVIAKHIVADFKSTFDGVSLTNGYHPAWLFLISCVIFLFGDHVFYIYMLQILINIGSIFIAYETIKPKTIHGKIIVAAIYIFSMGPSGLRGMEIDLFIFCFLVLFWALFVKTVSSLMGGVLVGLVASACILARIDSAVFVLPILIASPVRLVPKSAALLTICFCSAVYMGTNYFVFGLPFPISGSVKSLGGFHLNTSIIDQLYSIIYSRSDSRIKWSAFVFSRYIWMAWLAIGYIFVIIASPGRYRGLAASYLIGLTAYLIKILFLSSWVLWSWYCFPVFIGLFILAYIFLDERAPKPSTSTFHRYFVSSGLLFLCFISLLSTISIANNLYLALSGRDPTQFTKLNYIISNYLEENLGNSRVAMGDRAGSLGYFYSGGVVQLEGLVNDLEYLHFLKRGADPTELLCQRGVRYLVAYQKDLGLYTYHSVNVIRPILSDYANIPKLIVTSKDEIARIYDLSIFDSSMSDEGDSYVYIWRLTHCERGRDARDR